MSNAPKTGALTAEDLRDLWRGSTDPAYAEGFLKAGDGNGLEVWGQAFEVYARASRSIDVTTQAMFISPWSGQTNPPASGAAFATVTLTFARTRNLDKPLLLAAGFVYFEEETTDRGDGAPLTVRTGRRYTLTEDLVFHPGETGPFTATAIAEYEGYGFNNPRPGTIKYIDQVGAGFYHDRATITATIPTVAVGAAASVSVRTVNEADTFVPEHLGQYVMFTGGSNTGKIARMIGFQPPNASLNVGSTVQIALEQSVQGVAVGTFVVGELLTFTNGGPAVAYGRLVGVRTSGGTTRLTFALLSGGSIGTTSTVTGANGATMPVSLYSNAQTFVSESATASWRVMAWSEFGLTVTNTASPSGGLAAVLDELGRERNVFRAPSEGDTSYRTHVREIADVVAPNAIRRKLNKTLGAIPWCFREVGRAEMPGFYFDAQDAYDTDVLLIAGTLASGVFIGDPDIAEPVQLETAVGNNAVATGYFGRIAGGVMTFVRKTGAAPTSLVGYQVRGLKSGAIFNTLTAATKPATVNARRFHVFFDYTEFRAFFMVGVPRVGTGDFGFAYDAGTCDAYDATPYDAFYDGYSLTAADLYRRVYQAIDPIRAGGVTWQLYIEDIGCP